MTKSYKMMRFCKAVPHFLMARGIVARVKFSARLCRRVTRIMSDVFEFTLNGKPVRVEAVSPNTTLPAYELID